MNFNRQTRNLMQQTISNHLFWKELWAHALVQASMIHSECDSGAYSLSTRLLNCAWQHRFRLYDGVDQDSVSLSLIAAVCSANMGMTYLGVDISHCHYRALTICLSLFILSKWLRRLLRLWYKTACGRWHILRMCSVVLDGCWRVGRSFPYHRNGTAQHMYLTHTSGFTACVHCFFSFSMFEDIYHRRLQKWCKSSTSLFAHGCMF